VIQWLGSEQPEEQAVAWLNNYFNQAEQPVQMNGQIRDVLDARLAAILQIEQTPVPRIGILNTRWLKYAAAIIVLIGAGLYFYLQHPPAKLQSVAQQNASKPVAPTHHKAVLTLADGSTIVLDSAGNGVLARQGITTVQKADTGKITYQVTGSAAVAFGYNTMTTPRGGEYEVALPDGTQVWLNAGSSLTFPTAFVGRQREVMLTGEAYFEVVKDAAKPFVVVTSKDRVTVLGTHFNVNAYGDEAGVKTSLLEGSVQVDNRLLKPGQAYLNGRVIETDLTQDVAWKNGMFNFDNKTLEEVMRQLSRWYDLDIIYRDKVEVRFFAEFPCTTSVENVFKALELTRRVHFKREGKKVIVFR
jgi:ferric-dicitrate binding protein FerR (iron transport regulator)